MQSNLCFSHMIHIMLLTISADVHVFLLDFFLFQLFLIEHREHCVLRSFAEILYLPVFP